MPIKPAEARQAYARLLRRRRTLYRVAPVVGLLLLFVLQGGLLDIPPLLVWPLLIVYALAVVALMHGLDRCPWCGGSFHNGKAANGQGWPALTRTRCASCGEPRDAGKSR